MCQQKLQQTFPILLKEDIRRKPLVISSHVFGFFDEFQRCSAHDAGVNLCWAHLQNGRWHLTNDTSRVRGIQLVLDVEKSMTRMKMVGENERYVYLRGLVCICVCVPKKMPTLISIYNIRIKETSLCNMALVQKNHTISTRKL